MRARARKEPIVENHHDRRLRIVWVIPLVLVLILSSVPTASGEFKISRYIEPSQVSNLFTRHVRKGIIKRIGLTDAQLYEIRDAIDPYREKLLVQTTKLKDARITLFEAVAGDPFDPDLVRAAYAEAMAKELDLMLTVGAVLRDLRPVLTDEQIQEAAEMLEEIRAASEVRFVDFSEKLAAGELLGLKAESETGDGRR
jgi:Spy/CpxP family protein refolding chaperone